MDTQAPMQQRHVRPVAPRCCPRVGRNVRERGELARDEERADAPIRDETLQLVLAALGDALLGAAMARALALPRGRARELAARMLLRDRGLGEG